MNKRLKAIIEREEEAMIAFRRELHQHPELSLEEFETTKRVARALDELGIDYRLTEPTGIIAEIKGGKPGRTVLLRADMDALPIHEVDQDLSYRSQVDNVMHACGHDAHTSMLLTAAKALVEIREELEGNVRLVFQPSEENAQGARLMVEQGAVDGVDNAFGIHIWSVIPSHHFQCPVGEMMAAADLFDVKITGKGGHGSRPNEAIDAAVMASAYTLGAQSIVSREISPMESAVVTIGKMSAGDRFNVIAHDALLEGTVRTFNESTRQLAEKALRRHGEGIALGYRGEVEVNYERGTEPVFNDEESARLVQSIIQENFGDEALLPDGKTTGGEDFSYFYLENDIPGVFVFVGTGNPEVGSDFEHHHAEFNVDEDTLKNGAFLYAQYAYEYLKGN